MLSGDVGPAEVGPVCIDGEWNPCPVRGPENVPELLEVTHGTGVEVGAGADFENGSCFSQDSRCRLAVGRADPMTDSIGLESIHNRDHSLPRCCLGLSCVHRRSESFGARSRKDLRVFLDGTSEFHGALFLTCKVNSQDPARLVLDGLLQDFLILLRREFPCETKPACTPYSRQARSMPRRAA